MLAHFDPSAVAIGILLGIALTFYTFSRILRRLGLQLKNFPKRRG